MKAALKALAVFLLWNLGVGVFLLAAPPAVGLPAALILSALLLWGYLLRSPRGTPPSRRWATLRLRPLRGAALRWSLAAVPVVLLLSWALGDVYSRFIAVPSDSLNPFEPIMRSAGGRLSIAIFAVAVAPVVEEFVFRGLVQREIERRRGPWAGIGAGAFLFASVHFLPWVFPLHFFLGLAFGFAVYATGSIWTGVILHAANNSAALLGIAFTAEPGEIGTIWDVGVTSDLWLSLAILLVTIVGAAWIARKLLDSGRHVVQPAS